MTAIINMASVSTRNSIPSTRSHSVDEKEERNSVSTSRRRETEKSKFVHSGDSLSMNGDMYFDNKRNSNTPELNNSNNNSMNHEVDQSEQNERLVDKHNLVSVTENPFFKSYGKIRTLHTRNECSRSERERVQSDSSALSPKVMINKENENVFANNYTENGEEEEVEYHPGSGFVSKLLGKFKMKYEREEKVSAPIKRSTSLENILDERPVSAVRAVRGVKNENLMSVIGQSHLNYRTKSVELLNPTTTTTTKPVPVKRAPDAKLGRKDIVIIESSVVSAGNGTQYNGTLSTRSGSLSPTITTSIKSDDIFDADELPKPNTVTKTRYIFESSRPKSKTPPPRPNHSPGAKISAVAPTKNSSANITSSSLNREKAINDAKKINNAQMPIEVATVIIPEAPPQRSTLPPINNRNKKPSPVVTVAPYKPKLEESYSSSTMQPSVPVPQKPIITPLPIDKTPSQPKIITPRRESKDQDIIEKNYEKEKEVVTTVTKEIISTSSENDNNTTSSINNKNSVSLESNNTDIQVPVKGIPTIIAQRMRKDNSNNDNYSSQNIPPNPEQYSSGSSESVQNTSNNTVPATKKRQAPPIPTTSGITNGEPKPEVPEDKQEHSPRQNLHNARNKDIGGPAMVFDSSMVAKKKRKPNYSTPTNSVGVPKLDLTSINDSSTFHHGYQEGYKPTDIKPCKIIFIGAFVDTGKSLLKTEKSTRGRIKFNDQAITLHEYPSELHMLEEYLLKHPEEEEIIMLETFTNDVGESTDDDEALSTPRQHSDDDVLKSNTALSHSGGLSSYVSKYQEDFDWNNHREPEPIPEPEPESTDPDEVGIIPASEDDTNTWSESTTSDLLF